MAVEVFKRYESKYILQKEIVNKLCDSFSGFLELDDYNKDQQFYTISNIYYDTPDDYLIRHSLSKPQYKEKLRIRAYGTPKEEDRVFLEIKKKVCGVVNKRRTQISLRNAYSFVYSGEKPRIEDYMNEQVINEIQYLLNRHALEPKVYLAYDRIAFCGKEDRDLRITFDANIRTRRKDLFLEKGCYGEQLLNEELYLMEIKTSKSLPHWLVDLLSNYHIYKTSFSKYGREYQKNLITQKMMKGEIDLCLKQSLIQQQLIPQYQ